MFVVNVSYVSLLEAVVVKCEPLYVSYICEVAGHGSVLGRWCGGGIAFF
uniref:Uncharacterized protein n=1 Tax=Arundo donax TaxID=35708 RepID=A0A0A9CV18_ARUDO